MSDTVALATIHPADVSAEYMKSVFGVLAYDTLQGGGHILYGGANLFLSSGPNLASARNKIVEGFLYNTQAEWMWMVDADMRFDADTLERLLAVADKDKRPIVGGLCFGKKLLPSGDVEYFPTLYYLTASGDSWRLHKYPENELLEVDATGAACLLIHRSVLEAMAESEHCPPPYVWFQETVMWDKPFSEDITFCVRAKVGCGFPIYVHTGIEVGHVKPEIVSARTYHEWWDTKIKEPSFVVTGTGRSGSGFVSQAFQRLDIRVGHENWWNPHNKKAPNLVGDSSWLAVPYLDDYDGKVGLQLRDPLKVLGSLCNGELFGEDPEVTPGHKLYPYMQHKLDHSTIEGQTVEDAAKWIVEWVESAEQHADKIWRLEDLDGELFASIAKELAGVDVTAEQAEAALESVPREHNKHPNTRTFTWDELEGDAFDQLRELAERYGYA